MLSGLAIAHLVLAAIYAFIALNYALDLAHRGVGSLQLPLALGTATLGAWCVASACFAEATDLPGAELALRGELFAAFAGMAASTELAVRFPGLAPGAVTPRARTVRRLFQAVCAALAVIALTGAFFEGLTPAAPLRVILPLHATYVEPAPTALWWFAIPIPTGVAATLFLLPALREAARAPLLPRLVALASALTLLAWVHDLGARALRIGTVYVTPLIAILPLSLIGLSLLIRLGRDARELAERTGELTETLGALRRAQEELLRREQLAALGGVGGALAHEVRNPLAVIKNALATLRRPRLRLEDRDTLLAILREEVERLRNLDQDLLEFARPLRPRSGLVDLATLIASVAPERGEGPAVVTDVPADLPPLFGDESLLRPALARVVDNARQAARRQIRIEVREEVLDEEATLVITVIDDGEGMDAATLARAVDPFFSTRPTGIGLGLAIVDRVARNHGGGLELESVPGEGTRARLEIPRDLRQREPTR